MLDVCLLGTGGSIPKPDRWLASGYFRCNGRAVLIDCGEGTQLALKSAGLVAGQISLILLTHFHADHVSGLPGMLLAMANEGRTDPIAIAGPKGTARIVSSLLVIAAGLAFEIYIYEFPQEGGELPEEYFEIGIHDASTLKVTAFRARHSMPCLGYRISLGRAGRFDRERAEAAEVPLKLWGRLQRGETVEENGRTFTPDMVLGEARRGIDVSYVVDSRPTDVIADAVRGSDLLICEGMFGTDKEERAEKSRHMTAREAAELAKSANVRRLWLTHYSPSVPDPTECLAEAREIFPSAEAGFDGMRELLRYE